MIRLQGKKEPAATIRRPKDANAENADKTAAGRMKARFESRPGPGIIRLVRNKEGRPREFANARLQGPLVAWKGNLPILRRNNNRTEKSPVR